MPSGYTAADLLWERHRRRYRGVSGDVESQAVGFEAWCADNVKIAHPKGKRPFIMYEPQKETVRAYLANTQTLVLKARQIGFTTLTLNFCLWSALFRDDFSVIILSRREQDAVAALAMAKLAYDQLPNDVKARLPLRLDNNNSRMTFSNGSVIESHPAANSPARGRTASLMILDEWAFMPNPDDAWASVSPAAGIGGKIIALSTANGWGNTFHRMWVQGVSGDNNFKTIFFPWNAVPSRDATWYEQQTRDMLPWQLAQEYPSNPEEAFIKSGNPVFDTDLLRAFTMEDPLVGHLVGTERRRMDFVPTDDGNLFLYESPSDKEEYTVGVDVAAGLEHGDYSSAHVLNVKTGALAAHWHGHMDPDLWGQAVGELGWFYNGALVGVEVNNHGLTTAKALQRYGYPNIYFRKRLGSRRETLSEEIGWLTTKTSKPWMIDQLNASLRNGELYVFDEGTRQELLTYVRKPDGGTEGSPHDDRVISLAIANEMRRHVWQVRQDKPQLSIPKGSFAWEMEQMRKDEREQNMSARVLGRHNVRPSRAY